ncbi:receptor-like protein EIX2 [Henckelia pumila]|uniref:receptor-like protein EIX2 n=1 Tax=Henckelia pumila TaxID=405737 RepID=UPI003C6DB9ED
MNFSTRKLLYTCSHAILLVILFTFPVIGTIRVRCLEKERFSLIKIKAGVKNNGYVSKWGTKEEDKMDCCRWVGVQCDNNTNHVVGLYISNANFNGSAIPEFIGSLGKLQYLVISHSKIGGSIPRHLGNLSMLRHLDLHGNWLLNITDLDWLSRMHSLEYLELSYVDLSRATAWMEVIMNLPSLNYLGLKSCSLSATLPPPSFPLINTSTSLSFIDLSSNSISTTSILAHFLNVSRCFTDIDFSENDMMGKIPDALGNLTFLWDVDLSNNRLEGGVPAALWNSTMLANVDLSENLLHGSLPNVLSLDSLEVLILERNGFVGSVPDLTWCKSLSVVDLRDNKFNGTLTKSIGSLSELEVLYLSSNNLRGMISEVHLFNLSRLQTLDLSFNSNLTVKINSHWNPPFKLYNIFMAYCNLGPKFPKWILKAYSVAASVDISNAHISDTIEERLWNSSICFGYLNMSYNKIYGMPPDLSCKSFGTVDLSSNEFSGTLPLLGQNLQFLNLARNKLSGTLMNTCEASSVFILDLSNNQLSGFLPPRECMKNLTNLWHLNLANNFFSGEIPKSLGYLKALSSLHLRNNNFQGKFPTALRHCGKMHVLDLGENNFSGNIPIWMGTSLSNLAVLSLTSNEFYGGLPSTLCHLQNLQTLDLSLNKISGTIPKCIGNFSSMTLKPEPNQSLDDISNAFSINDFGPTFYDTIQITWKDNEVEYKRNLVLLKVIDLSSNKLVGQIPPEVTSLRGLFALNISRNNLSGSIPRSIGQLELLNSLDLSENNLSGCIPDTLSQLSHLGVLNLSFNNLSGRIPWNTHMQTFDSTSYIGNYQLCGGPLSKTCPEDETYKNSNSTHDIFDTVDDGEIITTGFYISMILGFIFGFWGILETLFLNKSCRHMWFKMLIDVNDWFCVKIAVYRNRM